MDRFRSLILALVSFISLLFGKTNAVIKKNLSLTSLNTPKEIQVILGGDVMLGRSVMIESLDRQKDPTYPFKKVAETLRKADLVFVNLENPVTSDCPRIEHGFEFCSLPQMVEGLTFSGVDVVSLANNHTNNFGESGLKETQNFLSKAGLDFTGLGNLVVKEVGGTKFGFLGFNFTVNVPKQGDYQLVSQSKEKVDILIVGVHWGEEYKDTANKYQREWARLLVGSGADIVVGHHSHWVEDMEEIEGKSVYYSLGNFVFDQMWSEETKKGLLIKLTFKDGKIVKEEKLPTYISSIGQPEFVK